jgi:polyphosphate kinase
VDPGHPFPYISTLSLSIAVGLRDPESGEIRFARVKIPPSLPRLFAVERDKFVLLDQVIEANLDELFRGMEILETHLFRVTRDADITLEEDEADDLLLAIEEEVRRRRFGEAVRLEVERSMPEATRQILIRGIGVREGDCFEVAGMLDLTALWQLVAIDRSDLASPLHVPVVPPCLQPQDEDEPVDVFAQIRAGDILVHHPYESFTASVERFLIQAANDPDVLTIKQTLYRTSGDSPIVQALIDAAGRGKQVVVLVEIKARFDEANNIIWARKLEQAGAHVVYGVIGLKTHSKVLLVVRREGGGLRRYVHIGTGNYNSKTARLYVDLGLLSCREELGADVTDLFNTLTGLSRQRVFRRLLVAPITLRTRFLELVEREVAYARAGHQARIALKVNSLVDTQVIEALYEASRAGVDVDLIVRGGCCLVPGIPGASDRIRVRSIIGEFLEHSRIWMFANGGRPEFYIGSADLMERNLDRRVEVVTPVEDHGLQARLTRIIDVMLADDRRSWQLQPDGRWLRTEVLESREGTIDTFATLKEDAATASLTLIDSTRPQVQTGSMDPRA